MELGAIIANIPKELKELPQWVCAWENSKIPMDPKEITASSCSDPKKWGTFDEACYAVEEGIYDYLGFVFNNNDIVGIDIDEGYDEEGMLSDLAYDIIDHCRSYTEISRSGRGMHIYVKGSLPFEGKNNGAGVEIYKCKRYFLVTGRKVVYSKVAVNQEGIDYVVDKYFKEELKTSRTAENSSKERIYKPVYRKKDGKISVTPEYPEVLEGSRHISMVSLAGQLYTKGYKEKQILEELVKANEKACKPPLPRKELITIVKSILKYER